jgi:uncharacterized protein YjbI with pentapeptide repeats
MDLSNLRLAHPIMPFADLRGAKLCNSSLWAARLIGADLENADLEGANLSTVYFAASGDHVPGIEVHVDLREANLKGANLRGARLHGARLDGANVQGADFTQARVTIEQLRTTKGEPSLLQNGKPPKAAWRTKSLRAKKTKGEDGDASAHMIALVKRDAIDIG